MKVYGVTVKLDDGEVIEFDRASDYGFYKEKGVLFVTVNGYDQLFNLDHVLYIARTFDLEEG